VTDPKRTCPPGGPAVQPRATSIKRASLVGIVFAAAWLLIAGISVHDGFLALLYLPGFPEQELNPFARLLLDLNRGNVWLLLAVKSCGTIAVCCILLLLYWRHRRIGVAVALGVASLQLLLLLILLKR